MQPYDHPVYEKLSLLQPYSFDPNVNPQSHFVILKTPLMWPPCYYDQHFMALGNGGRIYGVPLSLVCLIIIILDKCDPIWEKGD